MLQSGLVDEYYLWRKRANKNHIEGKHEAKLHQISTEGASQVPWICY
jgi:hypothetical protein